MIKKIGVLGSGTMGHGIAETFALYGYDVTLYDTDINILEKALALIDEELRLLAEEKFIEPKGIEATLQRIVVCTDMKKAVQDRDYVIEAVPEILELKQNIFRQLDEYCPAHTILASNTSSLPLSKMMEGVSELRKQRMIVNHWYNPAHLMPIVEMSFFGNMPEEIYQDIEQLFISVKKQIVKVRKDVPGLVANRIQQGVAREVFSIIEQGIADSESVDKALKFGPAFRYATTGQLEVADLGGLDIWCTVGDNLLKHMDNSQSANKMLKQKVAENKLGLKTGEGFYQYSSEEIPKIRKHFMKKLIHQLKASEFYIQD